MEVGQKDIQGPSPGPMPKGGHGFARIEFHYPSSGIVDKFAFTGNVGPEGDSFEST